MPSTEGFQNYTGPNASAQGLPPKPAVYTCVAVEAAPEGGFYVIGNPHGASYGGDYRMILAARTTLAEALEFVRAKLTKAE